MFFVVRGVNSHLQEHLSVGVLQRGTAGEVAE